MDHQWVDPDTSLLSPERGCQESALDNRMLEEGSTPTQSQSNHEEPAWEADLDEESAIVVNPQCNKHTTALDDQR